MAGKRMLHSNICESEKLSKVSYAAETLYYRLLSKVDDDGNFSANPRVVLGQCMPLRDDQTPADVDSLLTELSTVANGDKQPLVSFYTTKGEKYLHINRFQDFQYLRPDRTAVATCPTHPHNIEPSALNTRKNEGLPVTFRKLSGLPLVVGSNQTKPSQTKSNQTKSTDGIPCDAMDPTDAFRRAKRVFRRATGKNVGSLGNRGTQWSELVQEHGELLLNAFEMWAEEGGRSLGNLNWPLAVFLKHVEEYLEDAADEASNRSQSHENTMVDESAIAEGLEIAARQREEIARIVREEDTALARLAENPDAVFGG